MEILTVKEASVLWGISPRRITALSEQGRIDGAVKTAGVWLLPKNAAKPADARIKSGKYTNWRNKQNMYSDSYENNLKNLKGTMSVEGIVLSDETMKNLNSLACGEKTCGEIVENIKQKYTQRV